MAKISKAFTMTAEDRKAFMDQTLKSLAPYLVVIIPVMIEQLPKDWAYAAIVIWGLQRLLSYLLLWIPAHKV